MTRVCTKYLLIVENYAPAVILTNQSKRNELNVLTFTWFTSILNRTKISWEESLSIQVSDFGEKV